MEHIYKNRYRLNIYFYTFFWVLTCNLLKNIDKVHTTELGIKYIKKNIDVKICTDENLEKREVRCTCY